MLTGKKRPQDPSALIAKAGSLVGQLVIFSLVPSDTKSISPGRYVVDVWMTSGSPATREPVFPTSPFVLEPSVALVP